MSNPCDGLADNTTLACGDTYPGCSSCYCLGGQIQVLCSGDSCGSCSASSNPCGGSSTTCSGSSSGSTCYTCNSTTYDPATEVCPQGNVVPGTCPDGGPSLGCDSGSMTCDGFRASRRAGFRTKPGPTINSLRPRPSASVYARDRAKMLGHGRPTHPHGRAGFHGMAPHPPAHGPYGRAGFRGMAPHPPVPAHGPYGRPQFAPIAPCAGMSLGPDRLAQAERKMWSLAAAADGTYEYNADAAMTPESDMGQYHAPAAPMDYQAFVEDSVFGQETRLNHQRWANEVAPWSAGRARKVDTLEEENYVDWMGIRGPHNAVEVANPSQITQLNPSDLARWGARTRVGRTGGEPYECSYNWQG